jgi:hypothetical protein
MLTFRAGWMGGGYFVAKEKIMGLFEEVAGAVVAVEGAKKLDPDASVLTEGIAGIAGFEGAKKLEEHFENKDEQSQGS